MTIYKRGDSWRFDFMAGGERITGSGFGSRRAATAAEKAARAAAKAGEHVGPRAAKASAKAEAVTLAQACDRYWSDVACHHRSASDIKRRLDLVQGLIGAAQPIAALKYAQVSEAVQARRAAPGRNGRPLSPGTVNRDVIDALRPVLNHAAEIWELSLPRIAWRRLRLKEAAEIVREFSSAEIQRWTAELACPTERLFLATALAYGPRMGELYFPPAALRLDAPGGPQLELGRYLARGGEWRDSRKDGSLHLVDLLPEDAAKLGALVARAIEANAPTIWIDARGKPISYYAMAGRLRRAAARAGIQPGRIVHGMRHHAASAIARRGGIALAQRLLGHKQITTTRRYAHVSGDDMRRALAR